MTNFPITRITFWRLRKAIINYRISRIERRLARLRLKLQATELEEVIDRHRLNY